MAISLNGFTEWFFVSRYLKSRRLVVVFPAKANLLGLAIFKQRIPISDVFYNSKVKI